MKKSLLRFLALLTALLLIVGAAAACGKKNPSDDKDIEASDDYDDRDDSDDWDDDYTDDEDSSDDEDEDRDSEDTDDETGTDEDSNTPGNNTGNNGSTGKPNNQGSTGKNTTGKTTTGTSSNNNKPTKVDLKGYTVKIAAWWNLDPKVPTNVYYQQAVQREKEVREKYNVKFQFVNVPGQGIRDRLPASVLAGEPLGDIVRCRSGWVLPVFAGRGIVEPADKYFDVSDPLWNPYIIQQSMFKGHPMGVNHQQMTSYYRLFYNRSMMQRLGLADPQTLVASKQWTWAKFEEYLSKIAQDTDNDGKLDIYGVSGFPWVAVVASNGGKVVSDVNGKDVWTLNKPEAVEALKWYSKLQSQGYIGGGQADFVAGKSGFYTDYGTGFKANMKDKWGVLPFPIGPKAKDYASWWDEVHLMTIPKNSKYPKEVAAIWTDLSRWYSNAPSREKMHRDVLENMYDDPRDVEMDVFLASKFWLDKYFAYNEIMNELWPGGGQDIENVIDGSAGKTIDQWMAEKSGKMQNIIDQLWATFK